MYNVQAMTHDMPGTHQTRRRARSMTNSTRVQFGISFMLTLSPDEKHNAIFLRCARLRASDTYVRSNPDMAKWFQRLEPSLVDWEEEASPPPYEVRRRILTNSAISCVDGFKIHSTLLFKFLFGLKICLRCPFLQLLRRGRSQQRSGGWRLGSNALLYGHGRIPEKETNISTCSAASTVRTRLAPWTRSQT